MKIENIKEVKCITHYAYGLTGGKSKSIVEFTHVNDSFRFHHWVYIETWEDDFTYFKYEITGVDFNLYSEKNSFQFLKELEKQILISITEHENFTIKTSSDFRIKQLVNKIKHQEKN
jgi:hypothetical protein